eukprot:Filipodium_phascolosomae@DN5386_c0_g1_i1.p1
MALHTADQDVPCGTAHAMAPEVLRPLAAMMQSSVQQTQGEQSEEGAGVQPCRYERAVDLWAVGVLAYELLVGTAPFGYSFSTIVNQTKLTECLDILARIHSAPLAVDLAAVGVSPAAIDFVRAMLQPEASDRLGAEGEDPAEHPWFKFRIKDSVAVTPPQD